MSGPDRKTSAVIVTWNGAAWIAGAVASLRASSVPLDIIIVDNASTDATKEVVTKAFPDVAVLSLDANHGFARANNTGLQHALAHGAEYVLLLNQDAKVEPDTVTRLIEASERHPDFGILSPVHLAYDGGGIEPAFFSFINGHVSFISDMVQGRGRDVYETAFVNAAAWLLPRRTLETVGGLDPLFFMYGEDNDYCHRTRARGLKVGFVPRAFAYHQASSMHVASLPFKKQYLKLQSQIICLLKRPDHSFVFSCAGLAVAWTKRMLIQLMDVDLKGFAASGLAVLTASFRIMTVYRHYRECKKRGRIWL
ncbi:MAG: glycosyltransferase family 2 protein [Deltaproteobacteria bacterium]|nr:glycosyltransferase family 2 protein [Deltaproteobacteria bacterium]